LIITSLNAENFKNIAEISLSPDDKYNIISGKNAQGKTNILEAIWIMSGCRSFRGSKERDFIRHGEHKMKTELCFKDSVREQKIVYELDRKSRKITVNGVNIRGTAFLFDIFKCIIFTPDDTELVKGSPEKRRNFVDMAASQFNPVSAGHVTKCCNALNQRNAVLKNIISGISDRSEIAVWDGQLSRTGTYVSMMRHKYVAEFGGICAELYKRITSGNEKLQINYRSNVFSEEDFKSPFSLSVEKYLKKLNDNLDGDLRLGYTGTGVGRDDISIKIDGYSAREFASQGQIKSIALVMKLAQAEIFKKQCRESPIILLDDVMGELDENRQLMVFEIIKDMQVFITACNASSLMSEISGKTMKIDGGRLI